MRTTLTIDDDVLDKAKSSWMPTFSCKRFTQKTFRRTIGAMGCHRMSTILFVLMSKSALSGWYFFKVISFVKPVFPSRNQACFAVTFMIFTTGL